MHYIRLAFILDGWVLDWACDMLCFVKKDERNVMHNRRF